MKKKGLMVWTILTFVSIVILVFGFAFSSVTPVVGLYSDGIANANLGTLALADLYHPFVFGYETFFVKEFSWCWNTGLTIGIIALWLIVEIILIVMMAVKKKWKYLGYIFFFLLVAVLGLYVIWYVLDTANTGSLTIARQMVISGTDYFGALTFGDIPTAGVRNILFSIFIYVLLLGCLLTLVMTIGTFFVIFARLVKAPKVEKVKKETPVIEETPVTPLEAPIEEAKEVPVAPKKKKVVLIVKRYDAFKDAREPVIQRETNYPHEKLDVKPLTREDIRAVLREELDAREAKERKERNELNFINETVHAEVSTPKKEAISVSEADLSKEVKEAPQIPTPVIIAIPEPVKEEEKVEKKTEVVKEPSLSKDQVRDIIRDELTKALEEIKNQEPEVEEEVIEETRNVPVKVIEKIIEKHIEVPVEKIVEKPVEVIKEVPVEKPVEETKVEEPKVSEVKEAAEEPVIQEESSEVKEAAPKIERIPFSTRIQEADEELKDNYNHIKSLLMSYGLKNRVSNGGDAFRLHKVTYCKITVAGKSLKLYLALDPNDYKNSTLPIKDASSKEIYKDIPLVFKVKSGLSLRRAEQLITEMMDKHGIEQADRVEIKDYASHLADEETSSEDEAYEDED